MKKKFMAFLCVISLCMTNVMPAFATESTPEVATGYNNVVVTSVVVRDEYKEIEAGETAIVDVTVYNPTEETLEILPDNWTLQWLTPEAEDGTSWSDGGNGSGELFYLGPGEKDTIQVNCTADENGPTGDRILDEIYFWESDGDEMAIYYTLQDGVLTGEDKDGNVVHTLEYDGSADFKVVSSSAEEEPEEEPAVEPDSVIVESVVTTDKKVAHDESLITAVNIYNPLEGTTITVNPEEWDVEWIITDYETWVDGYGYGDSFELDAGERATIYFQSYVDEDAELGDVELYRINGEGITYLSNRAGTFEGLNDDYETVHTLPYPEDADFSIVSTEEAAEIESVELDTTEIVSGDSIQGKIVLKDTIDTSYIKLHFASAGDDGEYSWDMYADVNDLENIDGIYYFEADAGLYNAPGKYQLKEIDYRKDAEGYSYRSYDCRDLDIYVTVTEPEGTTIVTNGEVYDDAAAVLKKVEDGETLVITDLSRWYYEMPAEFLSEAKERDIKIVLAAAYDAGELILDPEKKMESYEDMLFLFYMNDRTIIEDEYDWMYETGVDAYYSVDIRTDRVNVPFKVRIKVDPEKDKEFYLFNTNEDGEFVLVDKGLECGEDGYVEFDLPDGIQDTGEYYLGVRTETTDGCTEHYSDNRYTAVKEATCVETGTECFHCIYCDTPIEDSEREIPLAEHTWDEGIVTTPSTCSINGVREHACTVEGCNATKEEAEPLDASIHTYSWKYTVDKMATCTEGGILSIHCVGCNEKHPALNCEDCGEDHPEILEITTWSIDHIYKDVITKATTKADGEIQSQCSMCGAVEETTTIYRISSITLSTTTYTYNGSVKTPTVTVKDSEGNKLEKNVDYTVSYASGRKKVGKYTVKITFKGNYSGTVSKTFKIIPKTTKLTSLTKATKAFTAKWSKQSTQVTGYQIQYARNKSFSGASLKTVTSYKTTSLKVTGLKAKTKYYVRVRTYKTVNGVKYYSNWSAYKTVKTK